jgi:predicted nucleic acid-binding protein
METHGQTIPENDIWIAAVALECDMPRATLDAQFQRADGLSVIRWQSFSKAVFGLASLSLDRW